MKPTVLFIDEVCPKPYDPNTLLNGSLGGTEAGVIRTAEGLAKTGLFSVIVEQHNRPPLEEKFYAGEAIYAHLGASQTAHYVICLRSPASLVMARKRFPNAKIYLWCHDLSTPALGRELNTIIASKAELLCVSEFHKGQTVDSLIPHGYSGQFPIKTVYNGVSDDLKPEKTPYNKNKLVWMSSPHKGLDYALKVFKQLKEFNPDFTLSVTNPGYFPSYNGNTIPGVKILGCLTHDAVISEVRDALCVFYPNLVFPETFGLVFAESNAIGTPVITHKHGAAREILDHPHEVMDCRDLKGLIDRVMSWHSGERPIVRCNPMFRMSRVIKQWVTQLLK